MDATTELTALLAFPTLTTALEEFHSRSTARTATAPTRYVTLSLNPKILDSPDKVLPRDSALEPEELGLTRAVLQNYLDASAMLEHMQTALKNKGAIPEDKVLFFLDLQWYLSSYQRDKLEKIRNSLWRPRTGRHFLRRHALALFLAANPRA